MEMKSESDFKKWFVAQFKKDCDITPIETSTSRGVPDLNLCRQGVEIWVELKLFVSGRVLLRPEQYAWGLRRHHHGGRVFIVALHSSGIVHVWTPEYAFATPHGKYVAISGLNRSADIKNPDALKTILFT
jgi:hypothetical protein